METETSSLEKGPKILSPCSSLAPENVLLSFYFPSKTAHQNCEILRVSLENGTGQKKLVPFLKPQFITSDFGNVINLPRLLVCVLIFCLQNGNRVLALQQMLNHETAVRT